MLSQRPGTGLLLAQMQDAHRASILDASVLARTRAPPPRLLSAPAIKQAGLVRLARNSSVLSEIVDAFGAARTDAGPNLHERLPGWAGGLSPYEERVGGGEARVGRGLGRRAARRSSSSAALLDGSTSSIGTATMRRSRSGAGLGRLPAAAGGPTATLHAARASAARSAALLETRVDAYLMQYRKTQRYVWATLAIQRAWRGYIGRLGFERVLQARRNLLRPVVRAWRLAAAALGKARRRRVGVAFGGWWREVREGRSALNRLCYLLQKAVGSGAATSHWRLCLDKRRRIPRPPDVPTVHEALHRCLMLRCGKRFFGAWSTWERRGRWRRTSSTWRRARRRRRRRCWQCGTR